MSKTTRVPLTALISALNLFPPDGRVWYKKKRNILRMALIAFCLIGMLVVCFKYGGNVRKHLWIGIGGYSGVLFFFSFFPTYVFYRIRRRQAGPTKADLGFMAFLFLLSFYPLIMLGMVTADIVQGPIDKVIHVEEKWDPKRGGDMVKTSEGTQYEIADRKIKMREGGTYRVKVLKHSKLILEAKKQR